MVSQHFKVWLGVIAITTIIGVALVDVVPAPVLYLAVSAASLLFVIYQAKNWDYIKRGGM